MTSREAIKLVEQAGWALVRVKGSHHQFRHPTRPGVVTIVHPRRDLKPGTLNSILKQAGLK